MNHTKNLLIIYKSVTGFTKEYAEMIAEELKPDVPCTLMTFQEATAGVMSEYDTVVFGSRIIGGTVDGLKKTLELFVQSKAARLILFATGATPDEAQDSIAEMWRNNLTTAQLQALPHFYMPGGLRYERMPWFEKTVMTIFSAIMKKKKHKTEYEEKSAQALAESYDISSRDYVLPLVSCLRKGGLETCSN